MIKINIEQKPTNFEDIGAINQAYNLKTEIRVEEDANLTEALYGFCKAMQIEGYHVNAKALYEAVETLKDYDEIPEK